MAGLAQSPIFSQFKGHNTVIGAADMASLSSDGRQITSASYWQIMNWASLTVSDWPREQQMSHTRAIHVRLSLADLS